MRALLVVLFVARAAYAAAPCPLMVPNGNVFIQFFGTGSGCSAVSPSSCHPGEIIQFSAATFGYDYHCATHQFVWDFGDGTTATGSKVDHVFVQDGMYQVRLTILAGSQVAGMTQAVSTRGVIYERWPVISYDLRINGVQVPLGRRFEVAAARGFGDWIWDFGDGTTARGPERTRDHVYPRGGLYTVKLSSAGDVWKYEYQVYIAPVRRRSAR